LSRRSLLQEAILLYLASCPVKTINELAVALHIHRPSVSRSLAKLREQGLVARTGGAWQLTEAGRSEVWELALKTFREVGTSLQRLARVARNMEAAMLALTERIDGRG